MSPDRSMPQPSISRDLTNVTSALTGSTIGLVCKNTVYTTSTEMLASEVSKVFFWTKQSVTKHKASLISEKKMFMIGQVGLKMEIRWSWRDPSPTSGTSGWTGQFMTFRQFLRLKSNQVHGKESKKKKKLSVRKYSFNNA